MQTLWWESCECLAVLHQHYTIHAPHLLLSKNDALQVSLNRLVHQNFHSVANIYEDRHQLCGFGPQAELLQQSVRARRVKVNTVSYLLF